MNVKDLMKNVKDMRDWEFERKLNELIRENYRFRNLDAGNKEVVMDLVKKYKSYLRRGIGISSLKIRYEMLKLKKNMQKLDLTKNDIRDIQEIMNSFKK